MLSQSTHKINIPVKISAIFDELQIHRFLNASNIRKSKGMSTSEIFKLVFLLVFQNKNWYQAKESPKGMELPGKDTIYRFLSTSTHNWRKFIHLLSARLISKVDDLTDSKRVKVFIVDDTPYKRERSKNVELISSTYDHVDHRFIKGFHMLALGWSDGATFVPVDFSMIASVKRIITHISETIDKRCCGYQRRKDCTDSKPTQVLKMLESALRFGINADYVLMDSWFTSGKMFKNVNESGLDVIGILKNTPNMMYNLKKSKYTLESLFQWSLKFQTYGADQKGIISSIIVTTKQGMDIKIVYVVNRNNRSRWLAIASTDTTLSAEEIVRVYGYRWDVEVFFKYIKSELKLDSEYQVRSFDSIIAHTSVVFARYIFLSWNRRIDMDPRTLGELFRRFSEEIKDIDFLTSLSSLLCMIQNILLFVSDEIKEIVNEQLGNWIDSIPKWLKAELQFGFI